MIRWPSFPFIFGRRRPNSGECQPEEDKALQGDLMVNSMTVADLDQVGIIERSSFPTPWSKRSFMSELTQNIYAEYIVARRRGKVVGYAGMWVVLDEGHVTNIAVHPTFRGQGIGDRLLRELTNRAIQRGATRMTLEVRPTNLVAQTLYARHGFVQRGVRRGYYSDTREDALIMWRDELTEEPLSGLVSTMGKNP